MTGHHWGENCAGYFPRRDPVYWVPFRECLGRNRTTGTTSRKPLRCEPAHCVFKGTNRVKSSSNTHTQKDLVQNYRNRFRFLLY